jgi:hypothetical protein
MKSTLLFLATIFVTAEGIGAYLLTHGERDAGGLMMAGGFFVLLMTEITFKGKS